MDVSFEQLKPDVLAPILRAFYAEVRTKKGDMYFEEWLHKSSFWTSAPPVITLVWLYLQHNERFGIPTAQQSYQGQLKKLKISGKDQTQHKVPFSSADYEKQTEYFANSIVTPIGFQQKSFLCYHFSIWMTREGRVKGTA